MLEDQHHSKALENHQNFVPKSFRYLGLNVLSLGKSFAFEIISFFQIFIGQELVFTQMLDRAQDRQFKKSMLLKIFQIRGAETSLDQKASQ